MGHEYSPDASSGEYFVEEINQTRYHSFIVLVVQWAKAAGFRGKFSEPRAADASVENFPGAENKCLYSRRDTFLYVIGIIKSIPGVCEEQIR